MGEENNAGAGRDGAAGTGETSSSSSTGAGDPPGGNGTSEQPTTPANTGTSEPNAGGTGAAGDDELERMRKALRNANEQAAAERHRRKEAETKLEQSGMSDLERQIAEARDAGRTEAEAAARRHLLDAELRAAAAGRLADPGDAARYLDLEQFTPDAAGRFDASAISAAIETLVAERSYLGAAPSTPPPPPPAGSADQGQRGGTDAEQIRSEEALKGMSSSEIAEAVRKGRLADLLAGKKPTV